jgi:hypothetical protein
MGGLESPCWLLVSSHFGPVDADWSASSPTVLPSASRGDTSRCFLAAAFTSALDLDLRLRVLGRGSHLSFAAVVVLTAVAAAAVVFAVLQNGDDGEDDDEDAASGW